MKINSVNNINMGIRLNNNKQATQPKFDFKTMADTFVKTGDKIVEKSAKKIHIPDETHTTVEFCSVRNFDWDKAFSPEVQALCEKHDVNPKEDLFIVSDLDEDNNRYVFFNTFFFDEQTQGNFEMLAYLVSEDEQLSDTQIAAYQLFKDDETSNKMLKYSLNNPLAVCIDERESQEVNKNIRIMAHRAPAIDVDSLYDENNQIKPIVKSALGK